MQMYEHPNGYDIPLQLDVLRQVPEPSLPLHLSPTWRPNIASVGVAKTLEMTTDDASRTMTLRMVLKYKRCYKKGFL